MNPLHAATAIVCSAVLSAGCSKQLKSGTAEFQDGDGQAPVEGGWLGHLGSNRDGRSAETGWNMDWAAREPERLWKTELGTGSAGVAVAGGRVYTLGNSGGQDTVYCLDASNGDEIWSISYPCPLDKRMFEGGPASTPTLDPDAGNLFVLSHEGELRCLDTRDGGERWRRHLVEDFAGRRPRWGYAGAPLWLDGMLIVEPGASDGGVVALDAASGEVRWRAGSDAPAYAPPSVFMSGGEVAVAVFNSYGLAGYAADDGAPLFRYRWETPHDVNAATPVYVSGHFFVSSGYGKGAGLIAVPEGGGAEIVYETRDVVTQFQSAVRVGGHAYVVSGDNNTKARLTCLQLDDGSVRWAESLGGNRGNLIAVADKLIAVTERGEALLARASAESFAELGRFQAIGGRCWAPPAFADGRLYVRNNAGQLACWDLR